MYNARPTRRLEADSASAPSDVITAAAAAAAAADVWMGNRQRAARDEDVEGNLREGATENVRASSKSAEGGEASGGAPRTVREGGLTEMTRDNGLHPAEVSLPPGPNDEEGSKQSPIRESSGRVTEQSIMSGPNARISKEDIIPEPSATEETEEGLGSNARRTEEGLRSNARRTEESLESSAGITEESPILETSTRLSVEASSSESSIGVSEQKTEEQKAFEAFNLVRLSAGSQDKSGDELPSPSPTAVEIPPSIDTSLTRHPAAIETDDVFYKNDRSDCDVRGKSSDVSRDPIGNGRQSASHAPPPKPPRSSLVSTPTTRVAPPYTPVTTLPSPVAPPDMPVTTLPSPVAPPDTSVTTPPSPVAPPDTPVTTPPSPVAPPDTPVTTPPSPVAPPVFPHDRPEEAMPPSSGPSTQSPASSFDGDNSGDGEDDIEVLAGRVGGWDRTRRWNRTAIRRSKHGRRQAGDDDADDAARSTPPPAVTVPPATLKPRATPLPRLEEEKHVAGDARSVATGGAEDHVTHGDARTADTGKAEDARTADTGGAEGDVTHGDARTADTDGAENKTEIDESVYKMVASATVDGGGETEQEVDAARLNRSQDNGILAAQGRDPATASRDPRARISPTPSPLPQRRLTPGTSNQASANTTPMSTPSVSPYPSPCPSPQPPQRRKQNEPTRPRASVPQICVTDCTFERMGDMPDNQIPQSHGGENLPYDDDDGDGYDYDEDFSDDDIDIMVAKHREVSDGRPGYGRKQSTMGGSTGSRESLTSLYSDAAGIYSNAPVSGDVEFALNYVESNLKLLVDVKQCVELGIGDRKKKRTDSYVKVYLLPDKSRASKRKTKPKKNTQNPQYNETLKFSDISLRELQTRTLWLSVWHDDKLGRNVFLGEVQIPLNTFNFQDTMPGWYPLTSRIDSSLQRVVSMDALEPTDKKCHRFKYRLSVSNSHLDELCLAKSKSKKKLIRKPPPSPPIVDMPTGEIAVNIRFIPPSIVASSSSKDRKKKPGKVKLKGDMHCLVKQARNLFGRKATGTDAFCRGYV
ncbi:PREDICTED: flocculation protein FLO11-like [Priapulus caudatus]|uniref:Flocculation protein FLO11-like n=1 Tax=Priapulus caudatus TaxID=37621 RepID=A0ABM1E7U1_PRICU|nr:PREDICTED: flocculation protein FLO11-like [Priapulus caudatus]